MMVRRHSSIAVSVTQMENKMQQRLRMLPHLPTLAIKRHSAKKKCHLFLLQRLLFSEKRGENGTSIGKNTDEEKDKKKSWDGWLNNQCLIWKHNVIRKWFLKLSYDGNTLQRYVSGSKNQERYAEGLVKFSLWLLTCRQNLVRLKGTTSTIKHMLWELLWRSYLALFLPDKLSNLCCLLVLWNAAPPSLHLRNPDYILPQSVMIAKYVMEGYHYIEISLWCKNKNGSSAQKQSLYLPSTGGLSSLNSPGWRPSAGTAK